MIAIIKRDPNTQEIIGWIIATDIQDAQNKALQAREPDLAQVLQRAIGIPEDELPTQDDLPLNGYRYTLLRY